MGKPTICIGENKDADQLRGNREADQRLCFRYSDSTIHLLLKSSSSFLCLYRPVCVGPVRKPQTHVHSASFTCKHRHTSIMLLLSLYTSIVLLLSTGTSKHRHVHSSSFKHRNTSIVLLLSIYTSIVLLLSTDTRPY